MLFATTDSLPTTHKTAMATTCPTFTTTTPATAIGRARCIQTLTPERRGLRRRARGRARGRAAPRRCFDHEVAEITCGGGTAAAEQLVQINPTTVSQWRRCCTLASARQHHHSNAITALVLLLMLLLMLLLPWSRLSTKKYQSLRESPLPLCATNTETLAQRVEDAVAAMKETDCAHGRQIYRRVALAVHPDKPGGSQRLMLRLNVAAEAARKGCHRRHRQPPLFTPHPDEDRSRDDVVREVLDEAAADAAADVQEAAESWMAWLAFFGMMRSTKV